MRARLLTAVAALSLIVAACGGGTDDTTPPDVGDPASGGEPTTTAPTTTTSPPETLPNGPSALEDMTQAGLPEPLVEPSEIISGGPPPDGIPPLDDPTFISVADANEWLADEEPVVYLDLNGDVRAYPIQVLIWHEIVNDTVDGTPVAVTYCPLCNSAVSYERTINGVETTFGTSGRLFASALVMYDRATESLWTHFDGRAVAGVLTGHKLEPIASPLLAWSDFKDAFPDGLVLDRDSTGFNRPYGENPYVGYDDPDATPFLFRGALDNRAEAMRRVVGVIVDDVARAWTLDSIAGGEVAVTNAAVGERPVVIFWKAGQSTALEGRQVDDGRDVGSVGVFVPVVDGEALVFMVDGGVITDESTGSTWDITGTAVSGPLDGMSLEHIHHLDTFWFSWSTYQPDTTLVDG